MNRHIDDIVKDALENFEVPYDPKSWDVMQQRIEHAMPEDFDEEIKSAVGNVHKTYQHKHWLQLKEWLDYSWYATNKIYINKMAECALMLLALFTFFNYSGHQQYKSIAPPAPAEKIDDTTVQPRTLAQLNSTHKGHSVYQTDEEVVPKLAKIEDQKQSEVPDIKNINIKTGLKRAMTPKTVPGQSTTETFSPTADLRSPAISDMSSSIADDLKVKTNIESGYNDAVVDELNMNLISQMAVEAKTSLAHMNSDEVDATFQNIEPLYEMGTIVAAVELSQVDLLSYSKTDELQAVPQPTMAKTRNPFDKKWAVSAFTDLNFNHITTPYDELYLKSGYGQNRVGYGGGLMVHRDAGPIELSSGVGYTSKKYSPKQFVELFKRSEDSEGTEYRFEGVKLNVLTIPVHASYFISKKGKWRPYVTVGGALHLALQAEYKKEDRPVSRSTSVPQYLDENEGATYTVGRTPNFEKKKFPDGLLENGSFKDNHYFTLDLGLGVERKISPSTSLFFQPTVYYNLFNKGLSANNDKINTFAMQIGVKTRI